MTVHDRAADDRRCQDRCPVYDAQDRREQVGTYHAQQDGDDLDHAPAPDIADNNDGNGDQGDRPVAGAAADGRYGQVQADGNDDRSGHDRREELHDLTGTEGPEQKGQDQIDQAGYRYAEAGIGKQLFLSVRRDGEIACQKGEGGTQKCRYLPFGQQVEKQCSETGEQQGRRYTQSGQQGHKYCRAEHGEHMLQSQDQDASRAQLFRVIDASFSDVDSFVFHSLPPIEKIDYRRTQVKRKARLRKKLSPNVLLKFLCVFRNYK